MDALIRELSGVLRGLAGEGAAAGGGPVEGLVRAVIGGGGSIGVSGCRGVGVGDEMNVKWHVGRDFELASAVRAYGLLGERIDGAARKAGAEVLRGALEVIEQRARGGAGEVGERLWAYWLLVLGREVLGREVEEELLAALWRAGTAGQDGEGRLHAWDAERSLDGFVFDELLALHAAANAAVAAGRTEMMEVVHRVARYHVANTQPDNTTNVPWGLAGFALFEETRSFAEQQMHDVRAHWARGSGGAGRMMAAGVVADALVTLRRMAKA